MNHQELAKRARSVACELMREKGYIAFVDLFMALEVLDRERYEDWRKKRTPYLERVTRLNLNQIGFVMKLIRSALLAEGARRDGGGDGRGVVRGTGHGRHPPVASSR